MITNIIEYNNINSGNGKAQDKNKSGRRNG